MTRCFVVFFDLHAQFWRDVCDDHISRSFWSCLHVRDLTFCMFQFGRDVLTIDLYLAFALSCIRDYILNFDEVFWQRSIFRNSQYFWSHALRCFSSKCSIRCVSHRRFDQRLSCFTENISFLLYGRYKQLACHSISSFLCQYECDLSEVANFCLIWITHRTWDNERIKSLHMSLEVVVNVYFISDFWICFCSVIHWSDSRIRALSVLLSFSNERITRQDCQRFYRRMQHVLEYAFA